MELVSIALVAGPNGAKPKLISMAKIVNCAFQLHAPLWDELEHTPLRCLGSKGLEACLCFMVFWVRLG